MHFFISKAVKAYHEYKPAPAMRRIVFEETFFMLASVNELAFYRD